MWVEVSLFLEESCSFSKGDFHGEGFALLFCCSCLSEARAQEKCKKCNGARSEPPPQPTAAAHHLVPAGWTPALLEVKNNT